jgi:hypothetical protein
MILPAEQRMFFEGKWITGLFTLFMLAVWEEY